MEENPIETSETSENPERKRTDPNLAPEEIERDLIAYLKARGGSATKMEIARNVGGTSTTRALVIADLISRGIALSHTVMTGRRGRPPTVIALCTRTV